MVLLYMFSLDSAFLSQLCVDMLYSCRAESRQRTLRTRLDVMMWKWKRLRGCSHLGRGCSGCGRSAELRAGT